MRTKVNGRQDFRPLVSASVPKMNPPNTIPRDEIPFNSITSFFINFKSHANKAVTTSMTTDAIASARLHNPQSPMIR